MHLCIGPALSYIACKESSMVSFCPKYCKGRISLILRVGFFVVGFFFFFSLGVWVFLFGFVGSCLGLVLIHLSGFAGLAVDKSVLIVSYCK